MATPERFDIERTRRLIRDRLQPGEDLDAAIQAGIHLARRRAAAAGRDATQADLELSLSIICLWPIKTNPTDEVTDELALVRRAPLQDAGRGDFAALDRLIPLTTLTASRERLAVLQQQSVRTFLNVGEERSAGA
jgi:hypothetical protein